MEVMSDHRATERVQPSILGGMASAGRFAALGAVLFVGGHEWREPAKEPAKEAYVSTEAQCDACEDPGSLPPGTQLVGRRLRIRREGVHDVIVRIVRRDGAVELDVNGKTYGLQDAMNVSVGRAIGKVEMGEGDVSVHAPEYGVALVTRAEIERVLDQLAHAESSVVTAEVSTRFTPKPGTALGAAIAMKRMWNGWKEGDLESCDVTFVRKEPAAQALAMAGNLTE